MMVLNWSCKTTKIEPPKPPSFSVVEPPKLSSMIGLPININIEGLSKSLNKKCLTGKASFSSCPRKEQNLQDDFDSV